MKKLITKLAIFSMVVIVSLVIIFFVILVVLPPQYKENVYSSVIVDKFNLLKNTNGPKIILLSGSSGAFGYNAKMISDEFNMPCINMSTHLGFGIPFINELSKVNIERGDILIGAYGYEVFNEDNKDRSQALAIISIENNLELYKYIPYYNYDDFIKYIPTYAFKKIDIMKYHNIPDEPIYNRKAFDQSGNQMILNRDICLLEPNVEKSKNDVIDYRKINKDVILYLNEFNKYVESKGAKFVLSFPPISDEYAIVDKKQIDEYENYLKDNLDCDIISKIEDYIMPNEYFFNTMYHPNNKGEKLRTEKIIRDLEKYISSNKINEI